LHHRQVQYIKELLARKRGRKTYEEIAKRFGISIGMVRDIGFKHFYWGERLAKQPETLFKEKVQKDLDKLPNTWHCKMDHRALRGVPDMILCTSGLLIAIELKRDQAAATSNDPRSKLQRYTRKKIRDKGKGISFIAYPKNWAEIYSKIKQLDKGEKYDKDYLWGCE